MRLHLLALAWACVSVPVWAQQSPAPVQAFGDQQEQRERVDREARERAARRAVPTVATKVTAAREAGYRQVALPQETPCFKLSHLKVDGDTASNFGFAQHYLDRYAGQCVGQQGVNLIVRRVSDLILARGYVTTRVGLPEQNLSSGTLTLLVIPGRLRAIRFSDDALPESLWRSAFPLRLGDVINLRTLEQGLEQLKRVPSQDATMELVPGDKPGESDVVITLKQQRAVRGSVTFDDSGSTLTSRPQLNTSLYLDNPLHRNDMLTLGLGTGMTRQADQGTNSFWRPIPCPAVSGVGVRMSMAIATTSR